MPLITSSGGAGGGSGTVTNVSSANTSIGVANPTTTPVLTVGTFDLLATNNPPAAAVAMNANKITGLANGSSATDAQAYGQGVAALLTASGDIVYASAANTLARLAKGSDGQVLTLASGLPSWAAGGATDGWLTAADTWTYASATTFTISGVDRTALFQPGTYLKLTQTTVKYFVVVSSTFSTNTTVTITGGTDYTLANASITSPFYSYQANPQGFPVWFNFTPGFTGFSANPTVNMCRFAVVGRIFYFKYNETANGTSNATTFTMTGFPFSAPSGQPFLSCIVTDNSTTSVNMGYAQASTTTLVFKLNNNGTGFTASGGKGATVNVYWQI